MIRHGLLPCIWSLRRAVLAPGPAGLYNSSGGPRLSEGKPGTDHVRRPRAFLSRSVNSLGAAGRSGRPGRDVRHGGRLGSRTNRFCFSAGSTARSKRYSVDFGPWDWRVHFHGALRALRVPPLSPAKITSVFWSILCSSKAAKIRPTPSSMRYLASPGFLG